MTVALPGDAGDRSFWTLVALSAVLRAATAYVACCLAIALAWQATHRGGAALGSGLVWAGAALLAVSAIGGVRAGRRLWRGLRATGAVSREVRSRAGGSPAAESAVRAARTRTGVTARVDVIESVAPFAFTYRLLRPRIVISSGLVAAASGRELDAVLAHESQHAHSRDPLKSLVADVLTAHHFVLPLLGHLRSAFHAHSELAADRRASAQCGTAAAAGALLKATDAPSWTDAAPASAMGAAAPPLLEARITQLESGRPPRHTPLSRWRTAASAAGAAAYGWALTGSALLIAATPPACMTG